MHFQKLFGIVIGFCTFFNAIAQINNNDSSIVLNEVVINAYQINSPLNQIPGSISILSGSEIYSSDGNSFSNTLHYIPGIYMHSGTYATNRIIIRGVGSRTPYNTNRIKSYLNDIPITSSDGISTPEDIDLTGIDRIEVIKGPASALYGSGLGGNINLYTPKVTVNSVKAIIQYGEFNTLKSAIGISYSKNDINIYSNLSRLQSDGYRENNLFKRTSFLSSGNWKKNNYSFEYVLVLLDMYAGIPSSIDKTLFDTNPRAAASNWKAIGGYKDYQKFITGITLKNRFSSKVNNRFSVFGRGVDSYEKRPFNNLDDSSFGGGIRNKMSYHANKLDLLLGIEWITDKYNWQMDVEGKMINMNFEYRNHVNLFGMTYYRPSKKWNISLGGAINSVRYKLADKFKDNIDYSGIRNFPVIFSPRMGINFTPSNQLALFASVGQGFSMPSPEETLLPEGNINNEIEPEHGIQYEAGMRLYLFRNKTWIETAVYLINLNNLLVTKRLTEDIFTGINAGRTRHKGVEIMLKQEIFNNTFFPGNLFLNINYTFSHNIFKDFTDDDNVYNGKQLPGIPSHIYQTNFHWNLVKQFDLYFQGLFVGSQFINDANSIKNNAYFINNIKVVYHFFSNNSGTFSFYLGINNITNAHYSPMLTVNAVAFGNSEPRYYYPGMPVHWYTGLSWKL